jgi:5-methylcytosine-specific restriction endonuclease McrA
MGEYEQVEKLTLDGYIERLTEMYQSGKKISKRKRFWRYLIMNNELVCPVTEKKVAYCSLDKNVKSETLHYNFYSEDDELFTIDHKIPKSKGGKDNTTNIQPMIAEENWDKGSKMIYHE